MAGIADVGAGKVQEPEKATGDVTIYFGIFFDGTNNHRLQVMIGKMYREKEKVNKENTELTEDEKDVAKKFTLDYQLDTQISKTIEADEDRVERLEAFRKNNRSLTAYDQRYIDYEMNEVNKNRANIASYHSLLGGEVGDLKDSLHKKDEAIQNNDFTNIALLEPFYRAKEEEISNNEFVYRIYVSGSGTDRVLERVGDNKGAGFGQGSTGVVQKVMDALTCINSKLTLFKNVYGGDVTLIFHLFGFSRGATEARIFAHVVNKQKHEPDVSNSLWKYVFEGKDRLKGIIEKGNEGNVSIPAMGIYDTVSSVGVLFKNAIGNKALIDVENSINTWSKLHHQNLKDLGLNDLELVDDVYHICALDEYRENFALVPIYESNATQKTEIYIPGCHADVGGGYSEGKDKKVTLYAGDNTYYPIITKPYHLMIKNDSVFNDENYVKLNNKQWPDQNMRLRLSEIGWVNASEKGEYNYLPPISFSFDKSTKKGYSYIGLSLMRDYFDKLFDSFNGKFHIPDEIEWLKDKINSIQIVGAVDQGINFNNMDVHPTTYAWLRSRFLHFSAEEYWNINQVKVNSPNFFQKGAKKYYCRIEYTEDYCNKVDEEYDQYRKKRLEQMENHVNQMLL